MRDPGSLLLSRAPANNGISPVLVVSFRAHDGRSGATARYPTSGDVGCCDRGRISATMVALGQRRATCRARRSTCLELSLMNLWPAKAAIPSRTKWGT